MSATGSSALSQNTLAPLGVFLDGQPNGNDPAAEAYFEKEYTAFSQLMGTRPEFYNAYTNFSQDPSLWGSSSSWSAWSFAQTGANFVGPTSGTVPLVGVPMADPTYNYGTVDNFYKQVISGQLDSDYTAIVDSWAGQGYKNLEFRIGYEFNGSMAWTPAANGSNNADFVAAWQHIANLIHAEGAKDGITAKTVWDPSTSDGSSYDVQSLYPGDSYVDVISADIYGGGTPNNLVDFATGGTTVDSTYAAWAAKPANLDHYYMYSNFTLGNPAPSLGAVTASGYGWSVSDTIAFAQQHGKPLGIDETGATSGQDDAVFPAWLASTIAGAKAEGVVVDHVDIWSNNTAAWDFVNGERPQEAAAWAAGFGAGSAGSRPPIPSITLSAPGTVQEVSIGAGVTVVETITTTNLTGNVYEEVLTAGGAVETGYTAVPLVNGVATASIHLDLSGDTVRVVDNVAAPDVTANSSPVIITNPPTISLSAPGTVQETAVGAGVTVVEAITTTNLTGNVYEEVLTASGAVETGYTAVALVNGVATTSVRLLKSGDTVRVVDNVAAPDVTANSSPVTITDPAPTSSIAVSSPGTVQEASVGAGVTVPLTVTATGLAGNIYYEVLTSGGAVETAYTTALPTGAAITAPTGIPQQKADQTFSVQAAFNYVPNRADLEYSASSGALTFIPFTNNTGITWNSTGQLATIPITNGNTVPHYFQVEDTSTSSILKSAEITYQVGTSSAGGTVTVASPTPTTTETYTISPHLAHSGDVVQVVNNPVSPTVTTDSAPVTVTDPVAPPTFPTVTIGSGSDTLALQISEDAWEGNAQFTVSVDGTQIGGTQTATAPHGSGQSQTFDVEGSFAAGTHTAIVDFLNDAYGGSHSTDRNLYLTGATIDGNTVTGAAINEYSQGPQSFTFLAPGSGSTSAAVDSVTVNQPAALASGVQTITGTETQPSQSVYLDWRTTGTPALSATDWVQATVAANGQFSASIDINHTGSAVTMFYHVGSSPAAVAWSATPA